MTTQELIDLLADKGDLSGLSADEVGRTINPEARKLPWYQKILSNAAAFDGVFGQDSEKLGRDALKVLALNDISAGLEDKRREKNKQLEIRSMFDLNNDGSTSAGELPLSQQNRLRSEGQFPTKTQDISNQVHGPTRSLFQDVMQTDESGGLIPDEFGGSFGSRRDVGPSETGKKALGSPQGADLLSALVGGDQIGLSTDPQARQGVEQIARQFDPSLQASQEVEDPDATLPDALVRQAYESYSTDLRTPRSQSQQVSVGKDQLAGSLRTVLQAAGIEGEQANALMASLPDGLTPAMANNLVSNVTQTAATVMREQQKNQRAELNNDRQDQRIALRGDLQKALQESGKALDLNNTLAVKQVIFEHAQALQDGRIDATRTLSEQRDARQLENRLSVLSQTQAFTREEHELNRAASYGVQVLRGEQALDLEGVRQLGRLALQDKKSGDTQQDTMQKFYLDFMKKNPAIAGDMLDILSQADSDIDPFTDKAIRGALAKRVQEIVDSQVVSERIRVTADTDIYGNTTVERLGSLHAAADRFLRGDPVKGIPPMSPEQVKPIYDHIEKVMEFSKAGASSTNVKIDMNEKPMNVTDSAKFAAMKQALNEMETVESLLFDEDGKINRSTIASASEIEIPLTGISMKGLPFTQGRELRQSMLNAVEARLRAESGAAVPDTEVIRAAERFFPSSFDSEKAVRNKIKRFKEYVGEAISLVDPVGTQRSRASSNKPVQSLQDPSPQKSFEQRSKELLDRGLSKEKVFEQLEQEGY